MLRAFLLILLACFCTPTSLGQDFSQRGFIETRGSLFPQTVPNDSTHFIGETLLRYEGFLTLSSSLQLAGAVDVRTDTHRQVDRSIDLSWQDRDVRRPLFSARRLAANYHRGGLTVEAGKQFVRWGRTDILNPTDRFAPRDFLEVVESDFLGVNAVRLSYEKGAETLDAVFSPRFTPSRTPLLNQRWTIYPADVRIHDAGVHFPGGSQLGIRWNHVGLVEFAVAIYRGFQHLPSFESAIAVGADGILDVNVQKFYPAVSMVGGDTAIPLPWFTVRGEAAYFSSRDDRSDEYVLYVVQLERQSGEWFLIAGYAGEAVTNANPASGAFAPDRGFTRSVLGRAGYTIDTNRSVALEAAVRQNGDGAWTKLEYSQAFGQHWRLTGRLTLIGGKSNDFLGQYRRNSHLSLVARYSF